MMAKQARSEAGKAQSVRLRGLKQDNLAIGLIAGALFLLVALAIWMANIYPSLPDLLPLHFDANGNPDRIAGRNEIWVLAGIGFLITAVNLLAGLGARLRFGMVFASYLLWGGAIMVLILLWLAAWNITH